MRTSFATLVTSEIGHHMIQLVVSSFASAIQYNDSVWKCDRNSGHDLPQILGGFIISYLHPPSGPDKVSGRSCGSSSLLLFMMKVMMIRQQFVSKLSCSSLYKLWPQSVPSHLQGVVLEFFCPISWIWSLLVHFFWVSIFEHDTDWPGTVSNTLLLFPLKMVIWGTRNKIQQCQDLCHHVLE